MQPAPASLAFEDVLIDFAGRRLIRGGSEQPLEPKAFDVLALLVASPGQVLTRDVILDAVWGHRHVTPGVVNRVMTRLRQALGEDAQHPRLLHTLHGVGYRFDLPGPAPGIETEAVQVPMPETPVEPPSEPPSEPLPEATQALAQSPMRDAVDRPRRRSRLALWSLPLLALLVLLTFAGWKWWPGSVPATTVGATAVPALEPSIAVLPLVNASNDPEQQYFSDGLSESLINTLSRFEELKVIGRISAFQFRDSTDDSATIGRKLGVSWLLGGSVQRAGDMVRINASLTNAADGSTLWAEQYDRPYQDLFALQDEITSAVTGALQVELLSAGATARHDDRPPSGNIDAYSAYLQGLKYWRDENFARAAEYMTRAVEIDPGYAMAWAHLSGSWSTVATFGNEPADVAREHMRVSRLAADKALQLAPGLGAAHAARAYVRFYGFDHQGALAGCHRAVQLAPDDGTVLNGCGFVLAGIGKPGEAIRLRERLRSIEPLYTVNNFEYAKLLMVTGHLDEAQEYLRIAEDLSPPTSSPSSRIMSVAIARGDMEAAQDVAGKQESPWRELYLAIVAQMSPDSAAADAALAKVLADTVAVGTSPYSIAQAYALRGDHDSAMEWLERAPTHEFLFMLADPLVLRLRDDPRLIALCRRIGLPPPAASEALSLDQIRAAGGRAPAAGVNPPVAVAHGAGRSASTACLKASMPGPFNPVFSGPCVVSGASARASIRRFRA